MSTIAKHGGGRIRIYIRVIALPGTVPHIRRYSSCYSGVVTVQYSDMDSVALRYSTIHYIHTVPVATVLLMYYVFIIINY